MVTGVAVLGRFSAIYIFCKGEPIASDNETDLCVHKIILVGRSLVQRAREQG